jgi:hypothetical protein
VRRLAQAEALDAALADGLERVVEQRVAEPPVVEPLTCRCSGAAITAS